MRRRSCQAGFALLEAVMATVILLLALVPLCSLMTQAYERQQRTMDRSQGQQLAAARMEELIAAVPLLPGSGSAAADAQPPYPGYTLEYWISSEAEGEVMKIVVRSSWQRAGQEYQYSLAAEMPAE